VMDHHQDDPGDGDGDGVRVWMERFRWVLPRPR
jgi:hypothetical protein